jgi:hypothetical protein
MDMIKPSFVPHPAIKMVKLSNYAVTSTLSLEWKGNLSIFFFLVKYTNLDLEFNLKFQIVKIYNKIHFC